ncbi:unnamed protein product, partial [Candidula unifasciata]
MADFNVTKPIDTRTNTELVNATKSRAIVSNEVLYYFLLFNLWGVGQGVCLFGIMTNILNIIVFVKQGVKDTVNISLLGLATSDLGSQITLCYANISFCPPFMALDLPFVPNDLMYIISWCHIMFTRISTWITAYITLERCLCVTAPLRVKNVFTPKRTVFYLQFVYIIMLASVLPCFYTTRPAIVFDPVRNITLLGITFLENRETIESITFTTNNAIPTIALCLVVICTIILVSTLRQKSKWRRQATTSNVVKMVVLISAIFIICYFPGTVVFIYMLTDQDMRIDGVRRNPEICYLL